MGRELHKRAATSGMYLNAIHRELHIRAATRTSQIMPVVALDVHGLYYYDEAPIVSVRRRSKVRGPFLQACVKIDRGSQVSTSRAADHLERATQTCCHSWDVSECNTSKATHA
jgi:hypothetical protein